MIGPRLSGICSQQDLDRLGTCHGILRNRVRHKIRHLILHRLARTGEGGAGRSTNSASRANSTMPGRPLARASFSKWRGTEYRRCGNDHPRTSPCDSACAAAAPPARQGQCSGHHIAMPERAPSATKMQAEVLGMPIRGSDPDKTSARAMPHDRDRLVGSRSNSMICRMLGPPER